MTSVPGVDHPEEQTEAEVTLTGSNISVSSRVESVADGIISVWPSAGDFHGQMVVKVGDEVEVYWKGDETQRAVPAEVVGVDQGSVIRWRMRITGPAESSQRRKAVRGRVAVPVEAEYGPVALGGKTIDLSEAGIRALFEGFGILPEPGTTMDLTVQLEDGPVKTKAEVVRTQARGPEWIMSIRFANIAEKDQDRVRRRVFQALREERAKTTD
jgi:c-di-GMP-binding flagellar brake protein YcgR